MDLEKGITEIDWEIAQMKKAMVNSSKKIVSLSISKKLDTINRYKICDLTQVDTMVTELDPSDKSLEKYQKAGLKLL